MAASGYATRPQQEEAASSSTTFGCRFDVFLSFRGADTRKNFTDHLYAALKQAGFHTFRDDDGIRRGEDIDTEIQNAIHSTKLSLIVFSKDYASSRWCLDELAMIMNLRRTVGHLVLPVFYDVDPSEVSEQTGKYGEAFAVHEAHFKDEMETVNGWRVALKEAAYLGGMVLQDRYQAQFINDIVKEVSKNVKCIPFVFTSPFVGRDFDVDAVNLWLQSWSDGGSIAVLYGLGGVGKTTIAKIVYSQNFDRFDGRSFLSNVRERSEQPNGLVHLQEQLLSDILNRRMEMIDYDVDAGNAKIKDALCSRKVLIVVDDVEKKYQLNAVIGMRNWLSPGSKIIITTRNESLLPAYEACVKFRVKPLDSDNSLQLFSLHAFGQKHPIEDYVEHSKSIVRHCSGLPLALEVIGSALSGRSARAWESALGEMGSISDDRIQKILKISYDYLDNDHHKNLFLDIACFFTEMHEDYVHKILSGLGIDASYGMQNLVDRCLIEINKDKSISMHPLIKIMGRKIADEDGTRIWRDNEAFTLLRENHGSKKIHGVTLNMRALDEDVRGRSFPLLGSKAFSKLRNLKYLKLNYVQLNGNYEHFPKKLTWLCWHGFSLNSIPQQVYLENLVVLDMSHSRLVDVWKGKMFLPKLKILDLSHSCWLRRSPDLSGVLCLEKLILRNCMQLVELHESIGLLNSLEELDLHGCSNLMEVPVGFGQLARRLFHRDATVGNIAQCITATTWMLGSCFFSPWETSYSTISSLPHSLVMLNLTGTAISHLPESIRNLNTLKSLWLGRCKRLQSLPELPHSLLSLIVTNCSSLQEIPWLPPQLYLDQCHQLVDVFDRIGQEIIQRADLYMLRTINMVHDLGSPSVLEITIVEPLGHWHIFAVGGQRSLRLFEEDKGKWIIQEESSAVTFIVPSSQINQEEGSHIPFIVPSLPSPSTNSHLQICGLTIWAVCSFPQHLQFAPEAHITNHTKGWFRVLPHLNFVPYLDENHFGYLQARMEMRWLSHWSFGYDRIGYDDLLTVYFKVREDVPIKHMGIELVYKSVSNEDDTLSKEKSITSEILRQYDCKKRIVYPNFGSWTFQAVEV